jgi:DNA-binding ferritin-like protein (Dps family)
MNDKYIDELPDKYKQSYLDYKKGMFDIEPWGSHQPLLIHVMNTISEGNVIELGMGDCSTPLLHFLCEKQGRNLFSYEFDKEWCDKYKSYESDFHKIQLLNEINFHNGDYLLQRNHYSIALIDSHPAWTRQFSMSLLKDSVDFFIVHDTFYISNGEKVSDNNYDFSEFKNVIHFDKVNRQSALFSNKEISEELKQIFI